MADDRCTCPPRPRGPPWDDGADFTCEFCEREYDEARLGLRDADLQALCDGDNELSDEDWEAVEPHIYGGCGGGERDPDLDWY